MLTDLLWALLPWLLAMTIAGGNVSLYLSGRQAAATGLLFVGASVSRFAIGIFGSSVRIEQPAIALLLVVVVLTWILFGVVLGAAAMRRAPTGREPETS